MTAQRPFNPRELLEYSVRCSYCGNYAELVNGRHVYPQLTKYYQTLFYRCIPCKAHIACFDGTKTPKGRLANPELRRAKMNARQAFYAVVDLKILQGVTRQIAVKSTYRWLAERLKITRDEFNFDLMTVEQCNRVTELCNKYCWYGME